MCVSLCKGGVILHILDFIAMGQGVEKGDHVTLPYMYMYTCKLQTKSRFTLTPKWKTRNNFDGLYKNHRIKERTQ